MSTKKINSKNNYFPSKNRAIFHSFMLDDISHSGATTEAPIKTVTMVTWQNSHKTTSSTIWGNIYGCEEQ